MQYAHYFGVASMCWYNEYSIVMKQNVVKWFHSVKHLRYSCIFCLELLDTLWFANLYEIFVTFTLSAFLSCIHVLLDLNRHLMMLSDQQIYTQNIW